MRIAQNALTTTQDYRSDVAELYAHMRVTMKSRSSIVKVKEITIIPTSSRRLRTLVLHSSETQPRKLSKLVGWVALFLSRSRLSFDNVRWQRYSPLSSRQGRAPNPLQSIQILILFATPGGRDPVDTVDERSSILT